MKSVASNSNKFHSMFKFSHTSTSCSILEMINSLPLSLLTSFKTVLLLYTIQYSQMQNLNVLILLGPDALQTLCTTLVDRNSVHWSKTQNQSKNWPAEWYVP